jgi:predicted Abi (CAAX) family protease
VKYFFLSDGWTVGRVWEFGGLWNVNAWRREPEIERMNLCILEQGEKLWLYRVEDAVLMVEVRPLAQNSADSARTIGQVVLKRLITAEQTIERLSNAQTLFNGLSEE